jgi:formate/nitrite transporter
MSQNPAAEHDEKTRRAVPAPAPASAAALTPAQIEAKAEALAQSKAALPAARCLVLAVFAGAFIAFGASLFGLVMADAALSFAVQRLLGGLCFCLGLQLVLCCGAELFTGNSLMVCGAASGLVGWGPVLKNWVLVWLGNFAGALAVVGLMYASGLQNMNAGAVGDAFVSVAAGKAALGWTTVLAKGVLCNVFVCLAVWIGFGAQTMADKVLGILLPITAFVALGFEHCVANMFFLFMGLACKAAGFGAAVAGAAALTPGAVCCNLALATAGNVLGGAVLVGLGYWFAYRRPAA